MQNKTTQRCLTFLNRLTIHVAGKSRFIRPLHDPRCKVERITDRRYRLEVCYSGNVLRALVEEKPSGIVLRINEVFCEGLVTRNFNIFLDREQIIKEARPGATFPSQHQKKAISLAVSVVIVTHNRAKMLERTLNALIPQMRPKDEIIIVDDGSTDKTPYLLKNRFPKVRYIRMPHKGYRMATMNNKGILTAKNEVIILLNDDCIPHRTFVECYRRNISRRKVLLGGIDFLDRTGRVSHSRTNVHLLTGKLECGFGGNLCFCKEDAIEVGLWTEDYNGFWGYADTDFLVKLKESGRKLLPLFEAKVTHQWHLPHPTAEEGKKRNRTLLEQKVQAYRKGIFQKSKTKASKRVAAPVKLIVGWVGETKRGIKRFKPGKKAVNNVRGAILKVASRDNFIPHDKMPEFYSSLDCLLISSQTEGHPLILYEAMACGIPVITTNVGDVAGIIQDRYNGRLLAKYCDIKDISNALKSLIENPKRARQMGLRGMLEIHRTWTWANWIPTYVKMFQYVLEKTHNPKKSKIKVLIIVDVLDWAWGFMAQEMKTHLPAEFVCEIRTHSDCESGQVKYEEYDVIYNHLWMKIHQECYRDLPLERMIIHVGGEAFHDQKLGQPALFNRLAKDAACISSVSKVWIPELKQKAKTFYCSRGVDTSLFRPSNEHKIRLTFIVDEPRWTYGILANEITKRLPSYYWTFIVKPQKLITRQLDRKSDVIYNWMWARRGVSRKLPKEKTIVGVNGEKYLTLPNVFREAVENSCMVLVNSTKIYEDVRKLYPHACVRLAHTGIDTSCFRPNSISHSGFVVGWIGNPTRKLKRYNLAKDALNRIKDVTFNPLFFHRDKPGSLIPHSEMPKYYNSLDCHLLVSTSESHSQQTYEAMACGLPVITTNVGCIDQHIHHLKNGVLLPVDCTAQQIRDAIYLLHDDPELRRRLGENARKTIVERVSWNQQTSMPAYLKAFEEVILREP